MKNWRWGFTTGTCAAAAAKAAVRLLCGFAPENEVEIGLPNGSRICLPVSRQTVEHQQSSAAVCKDAGDDPDVSHGAWVMAQASWNETEGLLLEAGEGVGTVTKHGLAIAPGQPAINPVPRRMIENAVREVTARPLRIVFSIPGGRELAKKTFNPRLGVVGGLSILGTTGLVRPFSTQAMHEALICAINVAFASGVQTPVLVPGRIGEKAARSLTRATPEQIIAVGNRWDLALDSIASRRWKNMLLLGHPGKLAKLVAGQWDTHSSQSNDSTNAVAILTSLMPNPLKNSWSKMTAEGIFQQLDQENRVCLARILARKIVEMVQYRLNRPSISTILIDLRGQFLGSHGDLSPWT